MWEFQAALSNNQQQWENHYIIHLGSRKLKNKKAQPAPLVTGTFINIIDSEL